MVISNIGIWLFDINYVFMYVHICYTINEFSHAKGGDLGTFTYKQMQEAFSKAAFNLEVGEVTQKVIVSGSGSHLIMRIE